MIRRYFMGWNFKKKLQPLSAGRPVGLKIVLKLSRSDFLVAGLSLLILGVVGVVFGAANLEEPAGSLLEIEAEKGTLEAPMAVYTDSKASGGKYVSVRSGKGGHAEYAFNIQEKGDYVVWCQAIAPNGSSDSFFVSMDNGEEAIWALGQCSEWRSSKVSKSGSRDPVVYHLTAGTHRIKFRYREPNVQLDKIVITKDMAYMPMQDDFAKWKDLPPPHFDEAIMWFFPLTEYLKNKNLLIKNIENSKRMGYTLILTGAMSTGFHYPTKLYPDDFISWSGYDHLGTVAEEARKRGMKVGAWIYPFKCHENAKSKSTYLPHIITSGEVKHWICPDHPKTRERALNVTKEVIEKYHPDLMILDYERYRSGYDGGCLCDYSVKKHAEFARTHPELSPQEALRKFSQENIESFVKEWVNLCKSLDPKIKTGAYTQYTCPKWVYGLPFDYPMKYVSRYLTAGPEGSTLEDVAALTQKYSEWTKEGNPRGQLVPILSAYDVKTPERMYTEFKIASHIMDQQKVKNKVVLFYSYWYLIDKSSGDFHDEGVAKAMSKALGGSWE